MPHGLSREDRGTRVATRPLELSFTIRGVGAVKEVHGQVVFGGSINARLIANPLPKNFGCVKCEDVGCTIRSAGSHCTIRPIAHTRRFVYPHVSAVFELSGRRRHPKLRSNIIFRSIVFGFRKIFCSPRLLRRARHYDQGDSEHSGVTEIHFSLGFSDFDLARQATGAFGGHARRSKEASISSRQLFRLYRPNCSAAPGEFCTTIHHCGRLADT